jgi:hypothetical protein
MNQCAHCGNFYENCLEITLKGKTRHFDCFECAIHMLAPICAHCGGRIIGHGVQNAKRIFCCAHCARAAGVAGVKDHVAAV